MSELYKRIEKLMKENNVTQQNVADACGFAPSRITDLKRGRSETLSRQNIIKVANYFGVSSEWLEKGEEEGIVRIDTNKPIVNIGPLVRSLDDTQLLLLMSACTEEMKKRAERKAADITTDGEASE